MCVCVCVCVGGGGVEGLYGLHGEAPPEKGTFFRHQVYERVGISILEVYEWVGKSVIWVSDRAQRAEQMNCMAF